MNTPINLDHEPIPEGWEHREGPYLSNVARHIKIPFRLAQRNSKARYGGKLCSHKAPAGILIRAEDTEAFDARLATWGSKSKSA